MIVVSLSVINRVSLPSNECVVTVTQIRNSVCPILKNIFFRQIIT